MQLGRAALVSSDSWQTIQVLTLYVQKSGDLLVLERRLGDSSHCILGLVYVELAVTAVPVQESRRAVVIGGGKL